MSDVQLKAVIGEVTSGFGYWLKQEQEDSNLQFTKGKRSSLCYILLPSVSDIIRCMKKKSMILVISRLIVGRSSGCYTLFWNFSSVCK